MKKIVSIIVGFVLMLSTLTIVIRMKSTINYYIRGIASSLKHDQALAP